MTSEGWPVPGAPNHDYRVVLGEECFDWRSLTIPQLRQALIDLADLIQPLTDGRTLAWMTYAFGTECRPAIELADALHSSLGGLPRDERQRLAVLLDKCRTVEPRDEDYPHRVRWGEDQWIEPSWGMAHALARSIGGRAMSCLVGQAAVGPVGPTATDRPAGWYVAERDADSDPAQAELHLMRAKGDEIDFWRGVLVRDTPEGEFFAVSERAFPQLLFADDLRFHHFHGSYIEVLPWMVEFLGCVNDHFASELSNCRGVTSEVQARFRAWGVDISPESPGTKQNANAWAQRTVRYGGADYQCDWHGKREWNRDRVHFSRPIAHLDNRILIGIFTIHLDT